MTILLTGGTGRTGTSIARLLKNANHPVLLASRSGKVPEPFEGVKFDWFDPSTYENPFNADGNIDRIYLVAPATVDMLGHMKGFIDLAITKGVKRFVLLSAIVTPKGDQAMGKVHEYLDGLDVDYVALRPSWFFANFTYQFLATIRDENCIVSTAGDGRIPFISIDDIADVAFHALVDEGNHRDEQLIVGPDLYTYDEVATILSEVLGRKIIHKRLSHDEAIVFVTNLGLAVDHGTMLTSYEVRVVEGLEEAAFHAKVKAVGKRHLRDYFQANRGKWIPK